MFDNIQKTVCSVASHVFETMFFTCLEPEGGEQANGSVPKDLSSFLRGEIGFEGNYSGKFRLFLPLELAKTLASNFMGLEEPPSDSQAVDVVNELCNMICGNLSSQLDKRAVWDITIPQTRSVSREEIDEEANGPGIWFYFNVEGYPVKLHLLGVDGERGHT